MSVTTTSGRSASTAASSESRSPHAGDDLDLGMRLEQAPDALAHEVVVLGEHETDRHTKQDTAAWAMSLDQMWRGHSVDDDERVASELVLIVDDNEKNAKLARDVLRVAGLRTLEAGSGGEALALAFEHQPDVILMDIRLPDMDGTDAARRLKDDARTADIPVVALTSLTTNGESFREAGFDGYLEKPISVAEFPEQVRGYCR